MLYVIGSGPSGAATAWALRHQGHEVTILDGGLDLEPVNAQRVARLKSSQPGAWDPDDLAAIRGRTSATPSGVSMKYLHGSDYPYRAASRDAFELDDVATHRSFSRGGHSNVWGAATLPYRSRDTSDWPFPIEDLAPHYRGVLEFMPLSGADDDLSELFPAAAPTSPPLRPSAQGRALLQDLARHRDALRRAGVTFGAPRLAVLSQPSGQRSSCSYCGMCLHGCPYDVIYSSRWTVAELARRGGVHYRPGVIVDRIEETGDQVLIHASEEGRPLVLEGERAFLGAGPLGTAAIMLRSLPDPNLRLSLKCSEYFLLPFLRWRGVAGVSEEEMHTLAQCYLELDDPEVDRHSVHMQLYGYNDLYERGFESVFGGATPLLRLPLEQATQRLLVIQGYLHSDVSSRVEARQVGDTIRFTGVRNPLARKIAAKASRKLLGLARQLRGAPLLPMLSVGQPGAGSHLGGSFPMSRSPRGLQSDLLGRPVGFERLHLVDASVLPSIASTTITFTTMANAHRIGTEGVSGAETTEHRLKESSSVP